jgi:hypothetical protein
LGIDQELSDIRQWMIGQTVTAADVSTTGRQSVVVIATRLHGGRVEIVPVQWDTIRQYEEFVRQVRLVIGVGQDYLDAPGMTFFQGESKHD